MLIKLPPNQSITVLPHVQRFATDCALATGAKSFGTYMGHSPPEGPTRALDMMVPVSPTTLGDAIAEFTIKNWKKYGVRYLIWRQRIRNEEIGPYWRTMPNRGDDTKNHMNHPHVTFYAKAGAAFTEEEELNEAERNMLRYSAQAADEIKSFISGFDKVVGPGEVQSFWDGQQQMINDIRSSIVVTQEIKDWFGQFDPQKKGDYWRGRAEVERRLAS